MSVSSDLFTYLIFAWCKACVDVRFESDMDFVDAHTLEVSWLDVQDRLCGMVAIHDRS
jgi:hypothetical protein